MKRPLLPILAALCLLLAIPLRFVLVGYSFTAYLLVALAVVFMALYLLDMWRRKGGRLPRVLMTILIALLALGVAVFAVAEICVISNARTDDRAGDAQYLVVLGAGVNGTTPSLSLLNRLEAALAFLNANPDTVAVVSGGQGSGEDITEAECMRRWLVGRGVPQERIIMEDRATNTRENLEYSFALIEAREGGKLPEPVAVLSSEYHLLRAKMQAHMYGAEPVGVAARTTLPFLRLNYFIREAFGVVYEFVT